MTDRAEVWFATSADGGLAWSQPQFLSVNAVQPDPQRDHWFNHNCSYLDMFVDDGALNVFAPHVWREALHLRIKEADLVRIPTAPDIIAKP